MRPITALVLAATFLASLCVPSSAFGSDAMFGAVGILHQKTSHSRRKLRRSLAQSVEFGPFYFDQKLDHFHINTTTFRQRYWVNSNHYKANGPVIFYNAGETDATERGGYVLNSTMHDLAQSLQGIVVVIEHRYYGESTPFSNYTTENLRFLNTDQALEDMANFIRTVKVTFPPSYSKSHHTPNPIVSFPRTNNCISRQFPNLSFTLPPASHTPWIVYGGSYSGNLAAWMRKKYPDIVFAAVPSSAPVEARVDFWQYFEPIRRYGPKKCIDAIVSTVDQVDQILFGKDKNAKANLYAKFGLTGLKYDDDFASLISYPLGNWENIVPGDNPFIDFCTIFNNSTTPAEYFDTYAEYLKALIVEADCPPGGIDACFTTHNPESSMYTDVTSPYRAWTYQTCTEYGYWEDAAPKGHTSLLSRKFDINWFQRQCHLTFGEQSITSLANVEDFNRRYGGWNVKLTRTIWVDGEWDPWRELSVQSPNAPKRRSTTTAPLVLIPQAVHHWDFDTGPSVPGTVKQAQVEILGALQSWLKHYYHAHNIEFRFQILRT
ncbi:serine carboxypeptidase S28-domain-containing protein [Jimgerdemannia flammicorona]|uniref:Serine carboxypeptidase S28-domain-containing protein n=1 Tax=Jimgerdemannia flammicorona TaxID=994334 RepID=A0A433DLW5_9FUNG|nr:serine carboxypeptidase S28-domain-containing protein [Jimgerdemannia flammicorona]